MSGTASGDGRPDQASGADVRVVAEQAGGVSASLLEAVAALDDEALVERARRVATAISAAEADLGATLAEIERRGAHGAWECDTVERFAGWHCQVHPARAASLALVGRAMGELPALGEAVADGTLSFDKARAVARVADPETERALVELALHATVGQTQRICRAWHRTAQEERAADEAPVLAGGGQGPRHGRVVVVTDDDGVELRLRFDHVEGALVVARIDEAADEVRRERRYAVLPDGPPVDGRPASVDEVPTERLDRSEWRAEGVLRMVETFRGGEAGDGLRSSGLRIQPVLHLTVDDLLGPDDRPGTVVLEPSGARVRREVARWFACDAGLLTVIEDGNGDPLHLGRRTQRFSPVQRRAVLGRYRTCVFPGCTSTVVHLHHVHHRAHGGHDDVENAVPECLHHHQLIHRRGIVVTIDDRGTVHHWRPDGTELSANPSMGEPPGVDATGAGSLLERRRLDLGADPAEPARLPRWQGDRARLADCVDAVLSRRDAARRRRRTRAPAHAGADPPEAPPPP